MMEGSNGYISRKDFRKLLILKKDGFSKLIVAKKSMFIKALDKYNL